MQNKSAIWSFAILLFPASLYQISFTWVVDSFENEAQEQSLIKVDSLANIQELSLFQKDSAAQKFESDYLLDNAGKEIYPLLGHTYSYCKKREINLGLDLQGGMHVTLEVSEPDLIRSLAGSNRTNPTLSQALRLASEKKISSSDDFITLFEEAMNEVDPDFIYASIFHNLENKDKIAASASNSEVISIIRSESEDAIKRTEQVLRKRVDNLGVVQPKIQRLSGTGRIVVELPGIKDKERVRKILQGTAKLEFWETYENTEVIGALDRANTILKATYKSDDTNNTEESALDAKDAQVVDDLPLLDDSEEDTLLASDTGSISDDTLMNELDALLDDEFIAEDSAASAQLSREEQLRENPLFSRLQPQLYQDETGQFIPAPGPRIGIALASDTAYVNGILKRKDIRKLFPPRIRFFWDAKPLSDESTAYSLYAIKVPKGGRARLEGDVVTDARVGADELGNPTVNMNMNPTGSKIWRDMTREASADVNNKRSVAVVLDNLVYSAPTVQGEIPGGNTEISGRFTQQEASDLAGVLKAGKLPARSHIIEEAVVGPSLGQESIDSGLQAFIIALVIILLYMIFYYSTSGIVADVALMANLFFVLGVLASVRATLTLPGIAGIVLTIGMSVDANVLIYERIREELMAGKGFKQALRDGYKMAYSSILDANITTLLTAVVLFVFGTGPIQGFATTLFIGILTSLFSAIFITRLIFEWGISVGRHFKMATKLTEGAFKKINIHFLSKRKMFYGVSGVIILISLASLGLRGLNYGVDFTGGRSYIVRFDESVNVVDIAESLGNQFVTEDGRRSIPEVKTFGASNQVKITTKFMINDGGNEVDKMLEEKLYDGLKGFYINEITFEKFIEELSSQKVEATIADDIKQSAVFAVLFALVIIFLYILLRFNRWQYSLGALVAMAHDVLIVLGVFSIFYGILPFSLEIDQAFIAAILTVVGYSINDTVVVFDRLREYLKLHPKKDKEEVINSALNSTLRRTINTSLSTFVVLLIIFIFGGEVIRGFIFAMMVGVIVGTYSSLYIATPITYDLDRRTKK
jgi:SecD/SecF fusion protein